MAWHDTVGRLASNEGTRPKAVHLCCRIFSSLIWSFSGVLPCSQSTSKQVWVKHAKKEQKTKLSTAGRHGPTSCVFVATFVSDPSRWLLMAMKYDEFRLNTIASGDFKAVQWTNGWFPLAYIALEIMAISNITWYTQPEISIWSQNMLNHALAKWWNMCLLGCPMNKQTYIKWHDIQSLWAY